MCNDRFSFKDRLITNKQMQTLLHLVQNNKIRPVELDFTGSAFEFSVAYYLAEIIVWCTNLRGLYLDKVKATPDDFHLLSRAIGQSSSLLWLSWPYHVPSVSLQISQNRKRHKEHVNSVLIECNIPEDIILHMLEFCNM